MCIMKHKIRRGRPRTSVFLISILHSDPIFLESALYSYILELLFSLSSISVRAQLVCSLTKRGFTFLSANDCNCNIHRKVALILSSFLFEGKKKKQKFNRLWLKHCWSTSGFSKKSYFSSGLISELPVVFDRGVMLRNCFYNQVINLRSHKNKNFISHDRWVENTWVLWASTMPHSSAGE